MHLRMAQMLQKQLNLDLDCMKPSPIHRFTPAPVITPPTESTTKNLVKQTIKQRGEHFESDTKQIEISDF